MSLAMENGFIVSCKASASTVQCFLLFAQKGRHMSVVIAKMRLSLFQSITKICKRSITEKKIIAD